MITDARIPIIKLKDKEKSFESDISVNNWANVRNAFLLKCYSECDPRVKPLVVIIRLWAQKAEITNARLHRLAGDAWERYFSIRYAFYTDIDELVFLVGQFIELPPRNHGRLYNFPRNKFISFSTDYVSYQFRKCPSSTKKGAGGRVRLHPHLVGNVPFTVEVRMKTIKSLVFCNIFSLKLVLDLIIPW